MAHARPGLGVYSLPEVSELTGLKTSRVREWFRGRQGATPRSPLFRGDFDPIEKDFAVSFLDLIDVYVAGQLRDHGVSLRTVRRVYERMGQNMATPHPFARQEVRTDGKEVFLRGIEPDGQEELIEVLTRQKVFPQIIAPFLKQIDYDRMTILACRWHIDNLIVVDPAYCFGKPIVEGTRMPTAILADAYNANDEDAEAIADWFNVSPADVQAAVRFEARMAA
jgi:uncharacterized protein (DUF433 family)